MTNQVIITDYNDAVHHEAFRTLNERWIRELFVLEEADLYEINHPMENIIEPGGLIFMAELHDKAVGTCAMMRSDRPGYDYDLVKFAVDPDIRGRGIGRLLVSHCINTARQLGAGRLFLESNRRCAAAVHLYARYGFKEIPIEQTDYARCDIQMELEL